MKFESQFFGYKAFFVTIKLQLENYVKRLCTIFMVSFVQARFNCTYIIYVQGVSKLTDTIGLRNCDKVLNGNVI